MQITSDKLCQTEILRRIKVTISHINCRVKTHTEFDSFVKTFHKLRTSTDEESLILPVSDEGIKEGNRLFNSLLKAKQKPHTLVSKKSQGSEYMLEEFVSDGYIRVK